MTKMCFSDRSGLHPQFLAPKTLGIFCQHNWVYANGGDFWIPPQGGDLVARRTKHEIETFCPTP